MKDAMAGIDLIGALLCDVARVLRIHRTNDLQYLLPTPSAPMPVGHASLELDRLKAGRTCPTLPSKGPWTGECCGTDYRDILRGGSTDPLVSKPPFRCPKLLYKVLQVEVWLSVRLWLRTTLQSHWGRLSCRIWSLQIEAAATHYRYQWSRWRNRFEKHRASLALLTTIFYGGKPQDRGDSCLLLAGIVVFLGVGI